MAYLPIDLNEDNAVLIIQTNDGASDANTYATEQELINYAASRGITLTSDIEALLIRAMDYVDNKPYRGQPTNNTQSTSFPIISLGIPRQIKQAQMAMAIYYDSKSPVDAEVATQVKSERVEGAVAVEYFESTTTESPLLTLVESLLKPYISRGLGLNVRVYRG